MLQIDKVTFEKARVGDRDSIDLIVSKYYKLAYSIAYYWVRRGLISKDDAISEANMALMQCIRGSFDIEKGKFAPYLARSVDNQIRMYLRVERRLEKIPYANNASYEDECGSEDLIDLIADRTICIEEQVIDSVLFDNIMEFIHTSDKLTAKERECVLLRLTGMTCSDIGLKMNMSQSYASKLYFSAIEKLKKVFNKKESI